MIKLAKWLDLGLGGRTAFYNMKLKADQTILFSEIDTQGNSVLFDPLFVYRFTFLKTEKWKMKTKCLN